MKQLFNNEILKKSGKTKIAVRKSSIQILKDKDNYKKISQLEIFDIPCYLFSCRLQANLMLNSKK